MFCSNCGTEIKNDAKFCFNCGAKNENAVNTSVDSVVEVKTDNKISVEKCRIFNTEVELSTGVLKYQELKAAGYEKVEAIYKKAEEKFVTRQMGAKELSLYDKCNVLASIGQKACNEMENECVDFIYQLQLVDYSKSNFISDIPKTRSYISYLEKTKDEVRNAKENLDKNAQRKMLERDIRKNSRGRFIGGGFGIRGAIKGSIQAGALNLFTGAVHTAVNAAGNTTTLISTSLRKNMIKGDVEADAFFEYLFNDLCKIVDRSLELLATKTDKARLEIIKTAAVEQASSILDNIESGKYSDDMMRELLCKGIGLNPLNYRYYFILLKNFPDEKNNIVALLEKLHISTSDFLEEALSQYADIEADDETIERLESKKKLSFKDVEEYRDCYLKHEEITRQYVCDVLGFDSEEIPTEVVSEYVENYLLGMPDEKFKKIEVASFTDSYELVFGPDYIWADTYEDMIDYLKARENFEKQFNNENTLFLYQFVSKQNETLSEATSFEELSACLLGFEKQLSELLAELCKLDSDKIFTEYIYDELNKILGETRLEIDKLPEYKKISEEKEQRLLEMYELRQEKFKKIFFKSGIYGNHCFNLLTEAVPPELMNAVSERIHLITSEKLLMVYGYMDGQDLLTGFVITDQSLYVWGLNGETRWKLGDIAEVSSVQSNGIMLTVTANSNAQKHKSVYAALNPINEYEDLLYKLNLFLTDINTKAFERKTEPVDKATLIVADEEHEVIGYASKHCVVGSPYITSSDMKKFDVATSSMGVTNPGQIFMMYDTSVLGNWKKGIAFCEDAIYHNLDGKQEKISWREFSTMVIKKKLNSPYIGNYQILTDGGDTETLLRLFKRWQGTVLTYPELFEDVKQENDTMFCAFCGKQIKRNVKFCNYCGEKVR